MKAYDRSKFFHPRLVAFLARSNSMAELSLQQDPENIMHHDTGAAVKIEDDFSERNCEDYQMGFDSLLDWLGVFG
jgi:hypothetical protein